jgi:hypothetical protein
MKVRGVRSFRRVVMLAVVVLLAVSAVAEAVQAKGSEHSAEALALSVLPRAERVGIVESVETIRSSLGSAQVALDPQAQPESATGALPGGSMREVAGPETPVTLVVAHGEFADFLAKEPRGAAAPTGSVMAFAINSETGWVLEIYVGDSSPVPQLGAPTFKTKVSPAGASRARVARARERKARPIARAATWGNKCSQGEGHHCYALAVWEMTGSEQVEGTTTYEGTASVNVPGWESGDEVNNEEWAGFKNSPVGTAYWTEIGQTAGGYTRCCSMEWFYAYQNHSGYHESKLSERWEIPFNVWAHYYMEAAGGGTWCFDIGENGETQVNCIGGFETYSKDLEDGTEIAANTGPSNAVAVQTNATWTNGTVHTWNKATNGLYNEGGVKVSSNGMCIAQFTPVNYPGNVYTGTSGNCP